MNTLHGRCHCGLLGVEFATACEPASLHPRACDCTFCRKHGAAWLSDPAGTLSVAAREPGALHEYRQGSQRARFLLCTDCGVPVSVVFDHAGRTYGAVNATCLDGAVLGDAVTASPQTLDPDAKVARWLSLWIPDVILPRTGRLGPPG